MPEPVQAEQELILINNKPFTQKGDVGVVMLRRTGVGTDPETGLKFQYFDYVTRFFVPPMRVAWDVDTMEAVLPVETADYLVKNGYARVMTPHEVRAYNSMLGKEETESSSRKPKRGEQS